jgi:NRAMP (natural resistance-associated macrophage protein)-like metal ion transporter
VLGCAIAISVLSNGAIPLWAGTLLTATDSFAFLFLEEAGVRYLELFFAALVGEALNSTPMCVYARRECV